MSEVQENLLYTRDHEWLLLEADGSVKVGITDHAQAALGELVFVELPEVGAKLGLGDACAVVESVKAASDVYCPIAGEITEVNGDLEDKPEQVNGSPYADGWIFRIRPDDATALDALMNPENYQQFVAALED